jgi:hypothetical protein
MPLLNQVYRDPLLSDVSIKYQNNAFVAAQVWPTLPVTKDTNYIFKYDKSNLKKPVSTARDQYARANRVDFGLTQIPLPALREASLEIALPDVVRDEAQDPFDPMIDYTEVVTEQILIEKEAALINLLISNVITQGITFNSTTKWNAYGTSNPFGDIQTGKTAILQNTASKDANVLLMGRAVFDSLINHPAIIDRLKYTQTADQAAVAGIMAAAFGVERVVVGNSVYNGAAEGLTDNLTFLWPSSAWLLYVAPTASTRNVSAGYFLSRPDQQYVDTWVEQERKLTVIRANDYYAPYLMAAEAVYYFNGAVA